nr:uncharacterized protein LOC113827789 [Penaeus vannamei]
MNFRSQRVSDLVAAVCIPASCLMYLHLMLLGVPDQTAPPTGPEEPLSLVERGAPAVASSFAVPPPVNVTGAAREDLLLMTPILKCGATAMRNLLKVLKNENKFDLVISQPKKAELVHIPQMKLQRDLGATRRPSRADGAHAVLRLHQLHQPPLSEAHPHQPGPRAGGARHQLVLPRARALPAGGEAQPLPGHQVPHQEVPEEGPGDVPEGPPGQGVSLRGRPRGPRTHDRVLLRPRRLLPDIWQPRGLEPCHAGRREGLRSGRDPGGLGQDAGSAGALHTPLLQGRHQNI